MHGADPAVSYKQDASFGVVQTRADPRANVPDMRVNTAVQGKGSQYSANTRAGSIDVNRNIEMSHVSHTGSVNQRSIQGNIYGAGSVTYDVNVEQRDRSPTGGESRGFRNQTGSLRRDGVNTLTREQ